MTWIWEGWNKASCPQRSAQSTPEGKACRAAVDRAASFKSGRDGWKSCLPDILHKPEPIILLPQIIFCTGSVDAVKHDDSKCDHSKSLGAHCCGVEAHYCRLGEILMNVSESSHLDERFGPDSGAHGQDSAGPSLQETDVTLQLPALHQRARLQGGAQTHAYYDVKQSMRKPEALG